MFWGIRERGKQFCGFALKNKTALSCPSRNQTKGEFRGQKPWWQGCFRMSQGRTEDVAGSEARLPADLALEAQVGQTRRLKATASPCSPWAVWTWWSGGWDQALMGPRPPPFARMPEVTGLGSGNQARDSGPHGANLPSVPASQPTGLCRVPGPGEAYLGPASWEPLASR